MSSTRTTKAAGSARERVLSELKADHRRVKKAFRDFQKLDPEADSEACETIVQQVLQDLQVHAALEEELLYPQARDAIEDTSLVDEAEVEHESAHALIDQLVGMSPGDEKYAARFTVLCEYVLHHVKEEEGELFPQLEGARLDWEAMADEMTERRAELLGEQGEAAAPDDAASATREQEERPETRALHSGNMPRSSRAGASQRGEAASPRATDEESDD